jgi:hypothetical protein
MGPIKEWLGKNLFGSLGGTNENADATPKKVTKVTDNSVAKPEESKTSIEEGKTSEEETKTSIEEGKTSEEESKTSIEEGKTSEEETKTSIEEGKTSEEETKTSIEEGKTSAEKGKTSGEEEYSQEEKLLGERYFFLESHFILKRLHEVVQNADLYSRTVKNADTQKIMYIEIQNQIRNNQFAKKITEDHVLVGRLLDDFIACSTEYSKISGKTFEIPKTFEGSLKRINVDSSGELTSYTINYWEDKIDWVSKNPVVEISDTSNLISKSDKPSEVLDKTESVQIQDNTGEGEDKAKEKKKKSKSKSKKK